jgi:probable rRNA maturation factor
VDDEIALLVVHGTLHLLGFDHQIEAEAEEMEGLEKSLLQSLYKPEWERHR